MSSSGRSHRGTHLLMRMCRQQLKRLKLRRRNGCWRGQIKAAAASHSAQIPPPPAHDANCWGLVKQHQPLQPVKMVDISVSDFQWLQCQCVPGKKGKGRETGNVCVRGPPPGTLTLPLYPREKKPITSPPPSQRLLIKRRQETQDLLLCPFQDSHSCLTFLSRYLFLISRRTPRRQSATVT